MKCGHDPSLKCYECHPEIWDIPQDEVDAINRRIYQNHVENLVRWNQAYREGNPKVPDSKYDSTEDALRAAYPDHPFFDMVGHDETKIEGILNYIPGGKRNPKL